MNAVSTLDPVGHASKIAGQPQPSFGPREVVYVCLCLIAFGAVLFSPQVLSDGDTYWHLAAGRWILEHGRVPLADPFSYTHAGRPGSPTNGSRNCSWRWPSAPAAGAAC